MTAGSPDSTAIDSGDFLMLKRSFCPDCGARLQDGGPRLRCPRCRFVQYRNPIVGVAVVIRDGQGRVLVGRRAKGVYAGLWCIPCGYVEWEEDVRDAAQREFLEETGLEVAVGPVLAVHSNFHNEEQHTVGIWFSGTVTGGELHPVDGELTELMYCDPAQPPELAFPTDQVVMDQLAGERSIGTSTYLDLIRHVPGANRADVTPIFADAVAFDALVHDIVTAARSLEIEMVAGVDALGFILAAAVSRSLQVGLAVVRKGGKLPGEKLSREFVDYSGESKVLELQTAAVRSGARILLIDEWIETGAQVTAAAEMLEEAGAEIAAIATICMDVNDRTDVLRQKYRCIAFA